MNKHYKDNNKQINGNKIYNLKDVKICSKCKQSKQVTEYWHDKSNSDELRYICKSCKYINEQYYWDNNKQINADKIYNENNIKTCFKWK